MENIVKYLKISLYLLFRRSIIMVCKMLFFDLKDSEKQYLEKNKVTNFDIKFLSKSLNRKTVKEIESQDLERTTALNIYTHSIISDDVLKSFQNLRVIVTRSQDIKHIDVKACLERNIAVVNVDVGKDVSDAKIVQMSLNNATSVLCGSKENRIV